MVSHVLLHADRQKALRLQLALAAPVAGADLLEQTHIRDLFDSPPIPRGQLHDLPLQPLLRFIACQRFRERGGLVVG